ncbi:MULTISPECIES: nuclease-related domain-containing protein [unclassified Marinobacter]|uniref:nuclease-related domain-containing protein n=1 Tax=unclassified Marinobacter TaxID=83889 RepID=UPI00200E7331|nr:MULTISPECIES: nuclease-related domain-containing protein [unclassified Marinobacter]UQG54956.1 NERD domain-containing protein [Marinobacter sp. M4C]UQG63757.1 NERD domain-containing protein [Marinobacter sp. M2C]UQG68040.1 NERD domain-containing protein [Marinobacter sp. M1C]
MDFNPMFQPLVAVLWYLIPIFIIAGVVKTPWFKGKLGEFLVNLSARFFLDKSCYHLIKNVTLPTEDGTTQIDHILVSEFGVFVVETKNMKGWIFGSATQPFWTQKIFRSSYKFQNPLHQNYKHVKTLQALLGLGDQQVHSVVVFVVGSTFKTPLPENVTHGLGYVRYIKSKKDFVLSPEQVAEAREKVTSGCLKASLATDQSHARHVRGLVAKRYGAPPRRSSKWFFKIVIYPVVVLGVAAIMMNAVSDFAKDAAAIGMRHASDQLVERPQQPVLRQPEIQAQPKAASKAAGTKTNSDTGIQRVYQPPSELFLARQDCNSLIAAVIGNPDVRLLRERDKACARYQILKE